MKRPITNIGILLLLIIVLPPLFFTTYEVGNLYQNEQMIDSIYTSQLESVLFSINQYSDDAVSGWANQIERDLQDENLSVEETAQAFIQRNMSVMMVLLADSLNIEEMFLDQQKDQNLDFTEQQFEGILQNNEVFILRFLQYMESGYRRIQPIDIDIPNHSLFLFAYYHSVDDMRICGLVVNSESFFSLRYPAQFVKNFTYPFLKRALIMKCIQMSFTMPLTRILSIKRNSGSCRIINWVFN